MELKINEEKFENNLVLCVDHRKPFAIISVPRSVFRNTSQQNKIRLFSIYTVYKRTVPQPDIASKFQ